MAKTTKQVQNFTLRSIKGLVVSNHPAIESFITQQGYSLNTGPFGVPAIMFVRLKLRMLRSSWLRSIPAILRKVTLQELAKKRVPTIQVMEWRAEK